MTRARVARGRLALATPAAIVVVFLFVLGLVRGPTLDASVFAQIAEQMRMGNMPYRDVFDHKPPGIFIALAAVGTILPFVDAWTREWGVTLLAALGTLALLSVHLGRGSRFGTAATLLALSPLLAAQYFTQGGGETESIGILPATAALVILAQRSDRGLVTAAAAGVLVAIACGVSFLFAPAAVGLLAPVLAGGDRVRRAAAYVAGGLAVALLLVVWLATTGSLPAALEDLVAYNRAYAVGSSFLHPIPLVTLAVACLICAPLVAAAGARTVGIAKSRHVSASELASLIWIGGWFVLVVSLGQFIGHYMITIAAPLAVLAAPMLERLSPAFAMPRARPLVVTVLAMSALVPLLTLRMTERPVEPTPPIREAAAHVSALVSAGDRIFVWGNEPSIYVLSGTRPAGRYIYLMPLYSERWTTDETVAALLGEWRESPPRVVVDASYHPGGAPSLPLLGTFRWSQHPPRDRLDPLRAFVREHYREAETVGGWVIYVLE